jgi:coenzyme F420-reducing hydrogenase beta subunit
MKPRNIIETVNHDLCIGCGVCAAVCPDSILEMRFNQFGEYNPIETADCTKECGLCQKVCPFSDGIPNEDEIGRLLFGEIPGIQHRPETGYFLDTFVGHSRIDGHREHGSSGGLATWLLQTLLEEGTVDAVVCVTSNPDPEKLFRFAVFTTAAEVRAASGSAYYPIELSEVLRFIIDHPGRYAVIGLPCFVKAIRLAQLRNRNLRERIIVVIGLVCGQLKSRGFTAYLAALAGLESAPEKIYFRGKDPTQPAGNFYFSFWDRDGEECRLYWSEGASEAWGNRWFTPIACNYCDDIFAECADVTFMDAWLPEYSNDPSGTSMVIVRSQLTAQLIDKGICQGTIDVRKISESEVVRSQSGVVAVKRNRLQYRLYRAKRREDPVPPKRVTALSVKNPVFRWDPILKEDMQKISRNYFGTTAENGPFDCRGFRKSMRYQLYQIQILVMLSVLSVEATKRMIKIRRFIHG